MWHVRASGFLRHVFASAAAGTLPVTLQQSSPSAADRSRWLLRCEPPSVDSVGAADRQLQAFPARPPPVKVCLTGFGPFGQVRENPTSVVCAVLREYVEHGKKPEGVDGELLDEFSRANVGLIGLDALEVSAVAATEASRDILDSLRATDRGAVAAAVIHLGVAADSRKIRLECRGVNVADFRLPDVRGCRASGEPVVDGAVPMLYTSLRLPEIMGELRDCGVDCEISTDAGRYLCNYIYFSSLHGARPDGIPVLFVHVPPFEAVDRAAQVAAVLRLLLAVATQLRQER